MGGTPTALRGRDHDHSVPHAPIPHCGNPQPPEGNGGPHIGRLLEEAVWPAGTDSSFSSRVLWQVGHSGCSLPRMSSSNS